MTPARVVSGSPLLTGICFYADAEHLEKRLLQPERLEEILSNVLGRRREHIAELNKRAAETELRLKRLYDAIEAGMPT
ncbi:MAG: hypothetical protein F8N37_05835 [Telmatospirillum sp.]|nr:hypothetical protein [Telmatospirillum sp.]